MCVCVCLQKRVLFGLPKRTGGVALTGDGFSLLPMWKRSETYAVRLIYCVAFTEMMKLSLTIYTHAHIHEH